MTATEQAVLDHLTTPRGGAPRGSTNVAPGHGLMGDGRQIAPYTSAPRGNRWRRLPEAPFLTAVEMVRRNHPGTSVQRPACIIVGRAADRDLVEEIPPATPCYVGGMATPPSKAGPYKMPSSERLSRIGCGRSRSEVVP